MVTKDKILEAVELLKNASQPSQIILFGSYARGDATVDSDLDLMVIKPKVDDRFKDVVELGRVLSPLRLPVEVLVTSEETFNEWSTTPGNIYYEVRNEGQVLYDSAS